MRWVRRLAKVLGLALLLWAGWLGRVALLPGPVSLEPSSGTATPGLKGALHVHTTASDGRADLAEVAGHAHAAGLDFLVLADHNVAPPPPSSTEGVLVVPGVELSTPDGHILAYGGGSTVAGSELKQEDPLGAARASGPLVVLSHPVNLRRPWTGPFAGADAMEVLSGDSAYREAQAHPLRLVTALLSYPASSDVAVLHLLDGVEGARARFHQALAQREVTQGFCSHDAHGLPAYQPIFRVLRTHLLPGTVGEAEGPADPGSASTRAEQVIRALAQGRFFCAVDGLADPAGFYLETEGPEVRAGLRGRFLEAGGVVATVLLYRDGEEVARASTDTASQGSDRAGSSQTDPGIGDPSASGVPVLAEARASAAPGRWHAEVELTRPWLLGPRTFLWILSGTHRVGPPEADPEPAP